MSIAITGASGKLGRATLSHLLQRVTPVEDLVAIAREPAKLAELGDRGVQLREADYTQPASLQRALAAVDRLIFISTSALGEERMLHHRNVVEAARAAGVKHVIYTSVVKPSDDALFAASPGHYRTEVLLRESGIPVTFFRNNLYLDLVPMLLGGALQTGKLLHTAGDGRVGFVLREDIAEALAVVASSDGHENRSYPITQSGPGYRHADLAAEAAAATGRPIESVDLPPAELSAILASAGLPPPLVGMTVALGGAMRAGEFDVADDSLERLLGRPPVSLRQFVKANVTS